MQRGWRLLTRHIRGAVAPIVALSLFALISVGGLAFDYARLASMDTELQNAADQAALAAASQLDGGTGARARATAAAQSLLTNQTLFANDQVGADIGGMTLTFYTNYDRVSDAFGAVATSDAEAKVVSVAVGGREALYALTPVVAALSSGSITAAAVAGIAVSVCKVPPLMVCNPNPGTDPDFTQNYAGKGLLLVARANNTDPYGPGNFGFLDTGYDTSGGAATLRKALGQQNFIADCVAGDKVTTEPGASSPALDAINTRFDIYDNNTQNTAVCGSGQCPPSANVRKDLMREASNGGGPNGVIKNSCKPANEDTGQKGWKLIPAVGRYLPATSAALSAAQRAALSPMGHPRDICHSVSVTGSCTGGRLGTGNWDRAAYFQSNYGASFAWQTTAGLGANVTRYQTYLWELNNQLNANPAGLNKTATPNGEPANGGKLTAAPVCQPSNAVTPSGDLDRRRLTVAIVNCSGANAAAGKKQLDVTKWVDIFLVEPSWNRTDAAGNVRTTSNDLYVEIIGISTITGPGGQAFQVERSVPYLIR